MSSARRHPIEPVEVICPECGLIAELARRRGTTRPKLCGCPSAPRVAPVRRPRRCVSCSTILNRYNPGPECSACRARSG